MLAIASRVAAEVPETIGVYISIQVPDGMVPDEAIKRAADLMPCDTYGFVKLDSGPGYIVGNMECPVEFYESSGTHPIYGPDDKGVKVEWTKS